MQVEKRKGRKREREEIGKRKVIPGDWKKEKMKKKGCMKWMWKKRGNNRREKEKPWIKIHFPEMSYTSLRNMQIHNTELHCSIYHNTASRHTSKNVLKTIRQNPRHTETFQLFKRTFPSKRFWSLPFPEGQSCGKKAPVYFPLHLHRISGVLALQAISTVMRTGEAAQKLGHSTVNKQQVSHLCYLPTKKLRADGKSTGEVSLTSGVWIIPVT